MKVLLDYTLHNREVIEVDDEEWEFLNHDKDTIMDVHLAPFEEEKMGYPIVECECSILDIEAFEPLSD